MKPGSPSLTLPLERGRGNSPSSRSPLQKEVTDGSRPTGTQSPVGCILAGGEGRRMGRKDKALIKLAGRRMVEHVIGRIGPQVSTLLLNANGNPSRFKALRLPVIADSVGGLTGPLAGILAGLEWAAAAKAPWMVSIATDTPFLPRDLVARLEEARRDNDIVCAASGGRIHPVIGLWPARLAPMLRRALTVEGIRRVDEWTARYRVGIAEWTSDPYDPFFNVNRPQDLVEAEQILSEFSP